MAISFDRAFGIHPKALQLRMERAEVLAGNIANAKTPGYKAKDFDFGAALSGAQSKYNTSLVRTNEKHITVNRGVASDLQYRTPAQPDTGDGNTVEIQNERSQYLQNQLHYNASLQFMTGRITGLKKALKGMHG